MHNSTQCIVQQASPFMCEEGSGVIPIKCTRFVQLQRRVQLQSNRYTYAPAEALGLIPNGCPGFFFSSSSAG